MRAQEFLNEDEPVRIKIGGAEAAAKARAWIEKVYAKYPQTMQNNHVMTWGTGDDLQFAMFELVPSFSKRGAVEVKWFQAYPLRSGVGSRAMKELQALAREDGVSLTLFPWDKGQVSQSKLTKFYKGQGFAPTVKGGKAMQWTPDLDEGSKMLSLDDKIKIYANHKSKAQHAENRGDYTTADTHKKQASKIYSNILNLHFGDNGKDAQNAANEYIRKSQGLAEDKEKNHWYDAGVKDATRGARPNPRTYLPTLKDKQAKHPEEVDFYMNGYKSVNQDVTESLRVDVPNEEWLNDAIAYAKQKSPTHYGLPYMGKTTATVRQVEVPLMLLRQLPGMRREQQNVRYDDLAAITKIMKDTGKLPIHAHSGEEYKPFINVAYDGSAWVNEGNHRIMAAYRLGWDSLPVEISYFDGGERVESGPMYPGKIGL
jgi:hypothetical protein